MSAADPAPPVHDLAAALARAHDLARDAVHRGGRVLLGITGPPGVGKSSFAELLAASLADSPAPGCAAVLAMDGFHLAQEQLERLGRADRKGAPDTFDAAGFVALLRRVRSPEGGGPIYAPAFSRHLEQPIAGAVAIEARAALVLVEGNYLLLETGAWAPLRSLLDECWYLDLDPQVRLDRLSARHVAHGRSAEAAQEWVSRSDEANAAVIAATRHRADRVISIG